MESWSDALLTNHRHLPRIQYLSLLMALLRYSITPLLLAAAAFAETPQATLDAKHRAFFKDNCLNCHNADKQKGKVRLDDIAFSVDSVEKADLWQKVLNSINSGEMPPEDEKQPDPAAKTEFLDDLSRMLVSQFYAEAQVRSAPLAACSLAAESQSLWPLRHCCAD